MKVALISGITGQDGSYLAEHLLSKGYEVHGIVRHASTPNFKRIAHLLNNDANRQRFQIHDGDLLEPISLMNILRRIEPNEIYNLAAQSHVKYSYEVPSYTAQVNGIGVLNFLEALRTLEMFEKTRFFQASTSELFANSNESLDEHSPIAPNTPYGVSKLFGFWTTKQFRDNFAAFASNAFMFSHESPRRGENFVSKKIVTGVASLISGHDSPIRLGNLNAVRDWGHALDYVRAMHLILNHDHPDDFVISTGFLHTLREFIEKAFQFCDIEIVWTGLNSDEKGIDRRTGRVLVEIDTKYLRPNKEYVRKGNSKKAREELGWSPERSFIDIVSEMMKEELASTKKVNL